MHIGATIAESTPSFAEPTRPPSGAPNVVIIVLDDVGFAQLGCYGSDIESPAIDGLAETGLRFNRFHVTALCSPTRACVLTGRNHHAVGMGLVPEVPMGFPGYTGRIPPRAGTLARILRDRGYSTFAVGKWHLTPRWEMTASGPFDRWPLGLGFERFYGFLGADTNQWAPELLACDNHLIEPPRSPQAGYHLTEDLADQAIQMVRDQQQTTPTKPFFLYFATGAMHAPHHAPPASIEAYRGCFDDGWDVSRSRVMERQLTAGVVPAGTESSRRPPWVTAWAELPGEQQRLFAHMMEIYAGFLTHTDSQIGRLLATFENLGILDDTLVFVLSDNGASAEGGPHGSHNENAFAHGIHETAESVLARADELGGFRAYNHYAWGWAWAGNTPFRLWKRYTWLGGTRTPLIAHWPTRITTPGAVRTQFCHAVDLLPTVLDAIPLDPPPVIGGVEQQPFDGVSLLPVIDDPAAPTVHERQYFEMFGSRAIYDQGWKAVTDHVGDQIAAERDLIPGSHEFDTDRWALFHLEDDFAEVHDRSADEPRQLRRLVDLWWREAGRNQVLPLDDTMIGRVAAMEPPPHPRPRRSVFRAGTRVAEDAAPSLTGSFRITADLEIPEGGAHGVLCAQGDWTSGWGLYVLTGRPILAMNHLGTEVHKAVASVPLPSGEITLVVKVVRPPSDAATCSFLIGGEPAGTSQLRGPIPFRWQIGGSILRIGYDSGFPICDDYQPPFPFSGTLNSLTFDAPAPEHNATRQHIDRALRSD
jgi:arylsulfatase A-like enzyme